MATPSCDVFISYKSDDFALAEDLHQRLVANWFTVWFDKARLNPGCQWHREIEAGCEASRIILPVLTPLWAAICAEYPLRERNRPPTRSSASSRKPSPRNGRGRGRLDLDLIGLRAEHDVTSPSGRTSLGKQEYIVPSSSTAQSPSQPPLSGVATGSSGRTHRGPRHRTVHRPEP